MKALKNTSALSIGLFVFATLLIIIGVIFVYFGIRDVVSTETIVVRTDNSQGEINVGISTTRLPEKTIKKQASIITASAQQKSDENQKRMNQTGKWYPTQYTYRDISKGSYVVKSGDTLWQIAVAVYGNGFDWNKILDANKSKVGYLSNGEQALIFPGQVLVVE